MTLPRNGILQPAATVATRSAEAFEDGGNVLETSMISPIMKTAPVMIGGLMILAHRKPPDNTSVIFSRFPRMDTTKWLKCQGSVEAEVDDPERNQGSDEIISAAWQHGDQQRWSTPRPPGT